MKLTLITVLGGLALAAVAAWAPPATTLGLVLAVILVSCVLVLPERGAIALLWGLTIVPLYLVVPSFAFPIPLELVVAVVLMWRVFIAGNRRLRFGTPTDHFLVIVVALGVGISTALSPERLLSSLNAISLLIWLFHIPLARTIYRDASATTQSLTMLAIVIVAQSLLGFAQLVAGLHLTMGILTSPLAPLFYNQNALHARLATQDFNWMMFDRAFPSGLFINSIVYGLCLTIGGLTLIVVPRSWYSLGTSRAARMCGALALAAAFASFKVTSWVAMLAGGCVVLITQVPNARNRLRTALIPLGLFTMATVLARQLVTRRLVDVLAASALARLVIWSAYLGSLVHHGLIGVGPGQARLIAPTFSTYAAGQNLELFAAPENSWLGLAVEVGVPATVALLLLLIRLAVRAAPPRITIAAPGIAAALVGCTFGVYGLTDEHILPLIALLGGMACAHESSDAVKNVELG